MPIRHENIFRIRNNENVNKGTNLKIGLIKSARIMDRILTIGESENIYIYIYIDTNKQINSLMK